MSEEKFYIGALEFWKQNKELDSLHLLNKFIEEKYIPKENIIKEVREYIEENDNKEPWKSLNGKELLGMLDKEKQDV